MREGWDENGLTKKTVLRVIVRVRVRIRFRVSVIIRVTARVRVRVSQTWRYRFSTAFSSLAQERDRSLPGEHLYSPRRHRVDDWNIDHPS